MPERGRDLAVLGGPAEGGGDPAAGVVDLAGAAAYRAAGPVEAAQLVDDRAADPGGGVRREAAPRAGVEGAGGLDEGEHAGRGQVVAVDVTGDPGHRLADDVADQREVLADQLVDGRSR